MFSYKHIALDFTLKQKNEVTDWETYTSRAK
jgi:hypothetical protein